MRSATTTARPALVFVLLLSLGGCLETTEPLPIVEARIAHAAPGLGTAQVLLDGTPALNVAPGQNTFFPLNPATHDYDFVVDGDTVGIRVPHDGDINAIVLMDRDEPTAFHFPMERSSGQRIMVINGDFTSSALTVEIVAPDGTHQETLTPTEHFFLQPEPGTFEIRVRAAGAEEFVDVEPFSLVQGDNGFLILAPVPDSPQQPYTRVLF